MHAFPTYIGIYNEIVFPNLSDVKWFERMAISFILEEAAGEMSMANSSGVNALRFL